MILNLFNIYTTDEIAVRNVTAYEIDEKWGTRVYTTEDGRYDMRTYPYYYPQEAINWDGIF